MKVRDLLARAGLEAEILVIYDESETELNIEDLDPDAITIEMHQGKRRVMIDLRLYSESIYVDSDQ